MRLFAKLLHIPVRFRMLLHFFPDQKKLPVKPGILRLLVVVLILLTEPALFFQLIQRKA